MWQGEQFYDPMAAAQTEKLDKQVPQGGAKAVFGKECVCPFSASAEPYIRLGFISGELTLWSSAQAKV